MSDWNSGYLNKRKMFNIYAFYLESSDVTDFDIWLKRHTDFTPYQIKRLIRFSTSETAKNILHAHAFD